GGKQPFRKNKHKHRKTKHNTYTLTTSRTSKGKNTTAMNRDLDDDTCRSVHTSRRQKSVKKPLAPSKHMLPAAIRKYSAQPATSNGLLFYGTTKVTSRFHGFRASTERPGGT
ncbi:unnamed protein product, partial [Ectocarpus sp. 8 AP-2014]